MAITIEASDAARVVVDCKQLCDLEVDVTYGDADLTGGEAFLVARRRRRGPTVLSLSAGSGIELGAAGLIRVRAAGAVMAMPPGAYRFDLVVGALGSTPVLEGWLAVQANQRAA